MKKIIFLLAFLLASFSFLNAQNLVFQNQDETISVESAYAGNGEEVTYYDQSRAEIQLGYPTAATPSSFSGYSAAVGTTYHSYCVNFNVGQMANYVGSTLHTITTYVGPLMSGTNNMMQDWTGYKVWIKNTLNGAIVHEQDVTSQVTLDAINNFVLTTPYVIPANTPLVIGFTVQYTVTTAGSRFACPFQTPPAGSLWPDGAFNSLSGGTNANAHGTGANFAKNTGRAALIWGKFTATPLANDLCAVNVIGVDAWKLAGTTCTSRVWVFNTGTTAQNNFTVQLLDPSNAVVGTTTVTTALAAGAHGIYSVNLTSSAAGPVVVKGKVILSGDPISSNDITETMYYDYIHPIAPLTYVNNGAVSGASWAGGNPHHAAIGYTAANSAPYAGKQLTAIRVAFGCPISTLSNCKVWIASALTTTMTYLYEQPFTPTNDGWMTVVLNQPFTLPSTDLYFGWTAQTSGTGIMGYTVYGTAQNADGGRVKNNTSAWSTLAVALGSTAFNHNTIVGVISEPTANVTITTAVNPAGSGTATPATQTVPSGTSVTLTATANAGYTFTNWTNGATVLSTANPYTFPATATATITANFTSVTTNCNPPTNLNVVYNTNCTSATLTWTAPGGKISAGEQDSNLSEPIGKMGISKDYSNRVKENNYPQELSRNAASSGETLTIEEILADRGPNSDVYYGAGSTTSVYKTLLSTFPGTLLGAAGTHIQASEYVNGVLYGVTYSAGNNFGTINQTTGAYSNIKTGFANDAVSMCYNPTNGLVYCFAWNGGSFGTVDLATGNYTHVGTLATGGTFTMYAAIDNDGVCYAIRNTTNQFGTINLATGEFTQKGTVIKSASAISELGVDRETNELYWASSPSPYTVYKINKTNGTCTSVGTLTNITQNPTVFAIATNPPAPCASVTGLSVTSTGSTVNLSWTAPAGSPTGYKIEYDGATLTTVTTTSYIHTPVPDGLHTYVVTALFGSDPCIPLGVTQTVIVGDMCIFKIEMEDDYGDGWDEAMIVVKKDGVTYGTATVPYDSYVATAFIVVPSGSLQFSWVKGTGSYEDECAFKIYNSNNEMIYECPMGTPYGWTNNYVFFTYNNNCGGGPGPNPASYNVYRNNIKINTAPVTTTTFVDNSFTNTQGYTWSVKAICPTSGESAAASKTMDACQTQQGDCNPPQNLTVDYALECGKATLQWDPPAGKNAGPNRDGWLKHCKKDDVTGRIGWGETSGENMTAAIRFTPSDLTAQGVNSGNLITKIAIGIGTHMSSVNSMELRIWEGGNSITNPGTLVYTQPITGWTSFPENMIKEIELTTPFVIDATKELRIGWNLVNTAGYPFGREDGPCVVGKGLLIHCAASPINGWIDAYTLGANWNYNYVMKAYIIESGTQYNVYRNGNPIATNIYGGKYIDANFSPDKAHEWAVSAVCETGGESGRVTKAMPACNAIPPGTCNPAQNLAVAYATDCLTANLTWEPPVGKNGTSYYYPENPPATGEIVNRVGAQENSEKDPNPVHGQNSQTRAWDLIHSFGFTISDEGTAAVATDGQFIYVTRHNAATMYKYNMSGVLQSTFTIPGITALRSITFDGTDFYGANAGTVIYKLNFNTPAIISTIPLATGIQARHCTYDPTANGGAGGFWVGDWAGPNPYTLFLVSKTGAQLQSIPQSTHGFGALYGTAFDNLTPGGPYLWGINADADPVTVKQIKLPAGTQTGVSFNFEANGYADPGSSGGGMFLAPTAFGTTPHLMTLVQNQKVHVWKFPCATCPAAPTAVTVTPTGTTLAGTLAWTNPSTTFGGAPLTSITKIVILRNNAPYQEITTGVTPGVPMTLPVTVTSAGEHTFSVYAVNAAGDGLKTSASGIFGDVCPITIKFGGAYSDSWYYTYCGAPGGVEIFVNGVSQGVTMAGALTSGGSGNYWKEVSIMLPPGDVQVKKFGSGCAADGELYIQVFDKDGDLVGGCGTVGCATWSAGYVIASFGHYCGATYHYLVYRDGGYLATTKATNYADISYNSSIPHKWEVKVLCTGNTLSAPVSATKPACGDKGTCNPPTNLVVDYAEDCGYAELNWTEPGKKGAVITTNAPRDFGGVVPTRGENQLPAKNHMLRAPVNPNPVPRPEHAGLSQRGPNTVAYAVDCENYYPQNRPIKLPLNNPLGSTLIGSGSISTLPGGGDWINGEWYCINVENYSLYKINTTTGAFTPVATHSVSVPIAMCYNPADGLVYVSNADNEYYTVNITTGATQYKCTGNADVLSCFAITNDGRFIVLNFDGTIDELDINTGNVTPLFSTDPVSPGYIQDMAVDRETNTIYWASYDWYWGVAELWSFDLCENSMSFVGNLPGELVGFAIPTAPNLNIPKSATNVAVTPTGTTLTGTLTWKNPSQTIGGTNLTTISEVKILRDGAPFTSFTSGPNVVPGATVTIPVTVLTSGYHTFAVSIVTPAGTSGCASGRAAFGDMCALTFLKLSTYSGWMSPSKVDVEIDGVNVASITMASGYTSTETIMVPAGELKLYWTPNYYNCECGLKVYNWDNELIFESPAPVYYVGCNGTEGMGTFNGLFFTDDYDCGTGTVKYNVYRDDALIATKVKVPYYKDVTYNPEETHIWSVKAICEDGLSTPATKEESPCWGGYNCAPIKNLTVEQWEDCRNILKWDKPAGKSAVTFGDPLKQSYIPTPIDIEKDVQKAEMEQEMAELRTLRTNPNQYGAQQSSTPLPDFFPSRGSTDPIYYGDSNGAVAKGTVGTPFPPVSVGSNGSFQQAYEYINGELYAARWNSGNQLGKINMTTGAWTNIGSIAQCDAAALCYNPANGLTYVFPYTGADSEGTNWGTINLNTGALTVLGSMAGQPTYIVAINNAGVAYASPQGTNQFGTINLTTGAFTQTATVPFTSAYIQNMSFDRSTGLLYWMAQDGTNALYYEVNVTTTPVTFTLKGTHSTHWMAFTTITEAGTPCPAVTNVVATLVPGTQNVNITWTASTPAPTNYEVYRSGTLLGTATGTSYSNTNVPVGTHIYTVKAIYPPASQCNPVGVNSNPVNVSEVLSGGCEAVVVGGGTGTGYEIPVNTYWRYSYTQQIYEATNLTGMVGKEINSISFEYIYATPNPKDPVTIYLGTTTKNTFASTTDWVPVANMTQVFTGPLNFNNNSQWYTINFPQPFKYTGGNLVVAVLNNHGDYTTSSNPTFRHHTATDKTLHYRVDGTSPINPASPPTAVGILSNRSNIRFVACKPFGYNIYKNGDPMPIATVDKETYTDLDADYTIPNQYCVTVACEAGGESKPVCITAPICKPEPCAPPEDLTAEYGMDCAYAKLNWKSPILPKSGGKSGSSGYTFPEIEAERSTAPELTEAEKLEMENGFRTTINPFTLHDPDASNYQVSAPVIDLGGERGEFAYGYRGGWATPTGHIKVPLTNPASSTLQSPFAIDVLGGEYYDGYYYCSQNLTGSYPLHKVNHATGASTILSTHTNFYNDLTYNLANNTMYALRNPNQIYSINMTTGAATLVSTISGAPTNGFITIACNSAGNMYAIELSSTGGPTSNFYSINLASNSCTLIGNTGVTAAFAQSMTFDRETGILYWASYSGSGAASFRTVNITNGSTTQIAASTGEICGLYIPYLLGTPCPAVTNVTAAVVPGTANVKVNWSTVAGATSQEVTRDGAVIATLGATANTYTDATATPGSHTYCVKAIFPPANNCVPVSVCAPAVNVPEMFGDGCEGKVVLSGNGTTSVSSSPMYTLYGCSYNQLIFTEAELGLAPGQTISSIAFNYVSPEGKPPVPVAVFMGHTTKNEFAAATAAEFIPFAQLTKVYQKPTTLTAANTWLNFTLDEPFKYEGGNLVVAVHQNAGNPGWFSSSWLGGNTGTYKNLRAYQDPYFAPGTIVGTIGRDNTRANIRFVVCEDTKEYNIYCDGVLIAEKHKGNEYIHDPANTLLPFNPTEPHCWEVKYIRKGDHFLECPVGAEVCLEKCAPALPCDPVPPFVVGTPTATTAQYTLPVNTYWAYSYTQQIFDAAEMGDPGKIQAISFQYVHTTPYPTEIYVYMGNTTQSTFAAAANFIPLSNMELVFHGNPYNFVTSADLWNKITLQNEFNYNGNNLVIAVLNHKGSNIGSTPSFRTHNTTGNKSVCFYHDSGGPINPAAPMSAVLNAVYAYKNNVMFEMCIDNAEVDMAATKVHLCPTMVKTQTPYDVEVTVKNNGVNPATDYIVTVREYPNLDNVLGTAPSVPTLAPGATATVIVPTMFNKVGEYDIRGRVEIADDYNPMNNQTANLKLTVRPKDDDEIVEVPCPANVGAGLNTIPFNFYYTQSVVQSLYTQAELGIEGGYIKDITWFYDNSATEQNRPVKVWMRTTELNSLSAGWLPYDSFTKVYEGMIKVPAGKSEVKLTLTTPYLYMGGNLVIMTDRDFNAPWINGVLALTTTVTPAQRTRLAYGDTQFNPANPASATTNTTLNAISNIRLTVNVPAHGKIMGTASCEGLPIEGVKVAINEMPGAIRITDNAGNYYFGFVPLGTYNMTATKFMYFDGYAGPIKVEKDKTEIVNFENTCLLPNYTVWGAVANAEGILLEGAKVELKGYENYSTTTAYNGSFDFLDVYAPKEYTLTITLKGYQPYTATVNVVGHTNLGTIVLLEVPFPPTDVVAVEVDPFVEITWNEPIPVPPFNEWIKWCVSDEVAGRVGYSATAGEDMTVGARFTPSDLEAMGVVSGHKITKIALGMGEDLNYVNLMEIRIWVGGTSIIAPGTLVYTQPITGYASLPTNAMSEFVLTTPFTIDASKEIRIGWRLVNTQGYPFGRDVSGSPVIGKGDLLYCAAVNANWISTTATLGGNFNFNYSIKAFVSSTGKSPIVLTYESTPSDNKMSSYSEISTAPMNSNYTLPEEDVVVVPNQERGNRSIVGYKLWRLTPGQENTPSAWTTLTNLPVPATQYTDVTWPTAAKGDYKWAVRTCYHGGVESDPAFSNTLNKNVEVIYTIDITTNSGDSPAGAWVELTNAGSSHKSYSTSTGITFPAVLCGTYNLKITFAGFQTYTASVIITQSGSHQAMLIEIINDPKDAVATPDECNVLFKWSHEAEKSFLGFTVYLNDVIVKTGVQVKEYLFTNLATGDYKAGVVANYGSGNSNVATANFSVNCLNIHEIEEGNYEIYPNPTMDRIYIHRASDTPALIEVYDAMGKFIQRVETIEVKYELNVVSYANGTYFIRVTEGTNTGVKSFVKQ